MAGEFMSVDVKGLKELDDLLKSLPEQIQRKALAQANLAGAAVLKEEAKSRAPVRSEGGPMKVGKNASKARLPGFLRASIKAWRIKKGAQGSVTHGVGTRGYAFYGKFLEFGTKYITPRPFLRPALDNAYLRAIDAVAAVLKRKVEKEIVKQAKAPNFPT
jgi:HK97 gp10 family phage protein